MTDFKHRENSGSLFKNGFKKEDKHPDYKGTCDIGGDEYEIAAWIKEGKSGKWMSLSFKMKDESPAVTAKPSKTEKPREDFNDDIPW